jgi:hypothetical protein
MVHLLAAAVLQLRRVPHVHDVDAWTDMKEKGEAYQVPQKYAPIHMPSNTATGVSSAVHHCWVLR